MIDKMHALWLIVGVLLGFAFLKLLDMVRRTSGRERADDERDVWGDPVGYTEGKKEHDR